MNDDQIVSQVLFCGVFLFVAIAYDLLTHKIPNWLSLAAIASGFLINSYFSHFNGLLHAFLGFVLAFVLLFPAFLLRILGAGDVKLMMGIGALMGPNLLLWNLAYGIAAGAVTSLLLILWKTGISGVSQTIKRYWDCLYCKTYFRPEEGEAAGQKVPYAPALAIGWLLACAFNPQISQLYTTVSQSIASSVGSLL
ncbi:A24 family peptidase [Shewanella fidelis]|uniref:A24 family peptidase n=1 Tax=Shewanella fidelis TaxID=173509 RepID=UPI00048AE7E4|nr:A24 family peptidase [Shewanella fidelis]